MPRLDNRGDVPLNSDRAYFRNHPTDRLLEIVSDWIYSARGMAADEHIHGINGAYGMVTRAHEILELVIERMKTS